MKEEQKKYSELLDSVDFSVAEHEMIYDKKGDPLDYVYLYVNNAFCKGLNQRREDVIGRTVLELFPNTEYSWIKKYADVVETGKAISFVDYSVQFDQYFSVYAYKSGDNKFVVSFKDITDYINGSTSEDEKSVITSIFSEGETAYFEFNLLKKRFDYSETLEKVIGKENITYSDYVDLFIKHTHPSDKLRVKKALDDVLRGKIKEVALQMRFYNEKKADYIWISYFAYVEKTYRNVPVVFKGIIKDIDNEKKKQIELAQMDRMFRETRKVADIATFFYNVTSKTFKHSKELDEFVGIDNMVYLEQMRQIVHPEDLDQYDSSTEEIETNPEGVTNSYRIIKNGKIRYIQSSIFGDKDRLGNVTNVFGILKDITEIETRKIEIEFFANQDILTGLFNRNNFEKSSKELDNKADVCIFICDVDGLKLINDAFGHMEGDELLIYLADTLRETAKGNRVYRIGGDEFVIVIENADEKLALEYEKTIKEKIKSFRIFGVGFDASIGYDFITENKTFEDAFRNAENLMYRRKLTERKSRKSTALNTIMQTMHEKTEETEEHCYRVGALAKELLKQTGKKRDYEIEEISLIADVHDIGKISISDTILGKPGRLDDQEYEKVKYHSESGYKIVSNIIDNEDIAIAVLYHHERFDGKGYPHGLRGEEIPLYSRIISICDAYDAMISRRVYREPLSKRQALKEIRNNAGTQFDPKLVDMFLKLV